MAEILETSQISIELKDELKNVKKSTSMEELQDLISEDMKLPSDIHLDDDVLPAKKYSEIQTVLIIGVTGMLGPYILRDICARPQIKKIYCLIRKSRQLTPLERLQEKLKSIEMIEEIDLSKISCVVGDICEENLGMSTEEYSSLSGSIDAIVHLGIKADYVGKYIRDVEKDSLRTVNVLGTSNILKFAVKTTLKNIYVASSLVCSITGLGLSHSEDFQDPETFSEVSFNFGYRISRFISEQLLKQAIGLGIPVKIFRFGIFGGDSKTGRADYTLNQYSLAWLTFLKLGYIPNLTVYGPYLPIDHYSRFSVELFFSEAPPDVYNVCKHDNPSSFKVVADISKEFGKKVKPVSVRKFVGKMKKSEKLPLAELQDLYLTQQGNMFEKFFTSRMYKSLVKIFEGRETIFENSKTVKYIPNIDSVEAMEESLRRDLKYLMESGAFEKYGIN